MAKAASWKRAVGKRPARGADGFVERRAIAGDCVVCDEPVDGPAVLARIDMLIDSRNAELAALRIA